MNNENYEREEMDGSNKDKGRSGRGQTLVEFALILTLLIVVLFAVTEFGRGWVLSNAVINGARAGVRFGSTHDQPGAGGSTVFLDSIENYTFAQITSSVPNPRTDDNPSTDLQVIAEVLDSKNPPNVRTGFTNISSGDAIRVTVWYDFDVLTGSIIPYFSGTKRLIRSETMRYEKAN